MTPPSYPLAFLQALQRVHFRLQRVQPGHDPARSLFGAEQYSQPLGCLFPVKAAGCHLQRQGFPRVCAKFFIRQQSVFAQKHQARRQRGPLVAIHEWVISA